MARVERLCPICRRVITDRTRTKCPNFRRHVATHEEKPMNEPTCGKCGKVMTPENARLRPELFLHDACLPDELKPNVVVLKRRPCPLCADEHAKLAAALEKALDACRAAIRYDDSIAGAAARGEAKLTDAGAGYAEGDELNNLDELYEDWIRKSRAALAGR